MKISYQLILVVALFLTGLALALVMASAVPADAGLSAEKKMWYSVAGIVLLWGCGYVMGALVSSTKK